MKKLLLLFQLVLFLSFVLFSLACGKKAAPRPPEAFAPRSVRFLSLTPSVDSVALRWQAPVTTVTGEALIDLAGFLVQRSSVEEGSRLIYDTVGKVRFDAEKQNPGGGDVFGFKDQGLNPGSTYRYIVVPVNQRGTEGEAKTAININFRGESSIIEHL